MPDTRAVGEVRDQMRRLILLLVAWLTLDLSAATAAEDAVSLATALRATSTTPNVISTGAKTFTTQPGKAFAPGTYVLVISDGAAQPANHMFGQVQRYEGDQLTIVATTLSGRGSHADWTIQISGPPGLMARPPGLPFEWSIDKTATDPGPGRVKVNNAPSRADRLYVSHLDTNGAFVGGVFGRWDASSSHVRGYLTIYIPFAPQYFLEYKILGQRGAGNTWDTFVVEYVTGNSDISIGDPVVLLFRPTGDKGESVGLAPVMMIGLALIAALAGFFGGLVARNWRRSGMRG